MQGLSLAFLLCASSPTFAQAPDAAKDPAAEAQRTSLYQEGKALTLAERWGEAIEKFEQVVAIRSAPPALYALALAQERAGRLASAKKTYERTARDARAGGDTKMTEDAEGALRALAPRVPRIQLRMSRQTAGAKVRVDRAVAVSSVAGQLEVEVDPGKRLVEVDAPGHDKWSREVTLRAGQVETLEVTLRASSTQPGGAASGRPSSDGIVAAAVLRPARWCSARAAWRSASAVLFCASPRRAITTRLASNATRIRVAVTVR